MLPNFKRFDLQTGCFYSLPHPEILMNFGPFDKTCASTFLTRTNLRLKHDSANPAEIELKQESGYGIEEYEMTVTTKDVCIKAATEKAIIYALTSLYQLMEKDGRIPCCQVHDSPQYEHRGLSFDCVRHFFPASEVKRILEQMSLVKMNVLHWHLTDDQGWRIESKKYPKLHQQQGNEFFTQEEIHDVVAYANARGIEVIPEIDMPGHMTALLTAYPQFGCFGKEVKLATGGGIYPVILCAGKEQTYQMIEDLLDEICPLFPSGRFHIGGDEAPKREWKACPHCQQMIRENSLSNEKQLQGYFSNRIIELLKMRGKEVICWNDSLEAGNLESSASIQFWSVNFADQTAAFAERGGRFIYSDMFTYYLDYPYSMTPMKRLYEDLPTIGEIDYTNNPAMLGLEACIWAEHLVESEELEKRLFPRLYAAAEKMWGTRGDYNEFEKRLSAFLKKHHPTDIGCVAEDGWNPQGEERRAESFGYMAALTSGMSPEVQETTMETAAPSELFQRKMIESFFDPSDLPFLMQMMQGEPKD